MDSLHTKHPLSLHHNYNSKIPHSYSARFTLFSACLARYLSNYYPSLEFLEPHVGCQKGLSWFSLGGCQVPTKTTLSLPLLSLTGEIKYEERLVGQEKDRERSLPHYLHRQNRLNSGKLV